MNDRYNIFRNRLTRVDELRRVANPARQVKIGRQVRELLEVTAVTQYATPGQRRWALLTESELVAEAKLAAKATEDVQ